MKVPMADILQSIDDPSTISSIQPVSGGEINEAFLAVTERGRYFIKYRADAPEGLFQAEACGLEKLRACRALTIPRVFGIGSNYLIMEWMEGKPGPQFMEQLGQGAAAVHRVQAEQYGFERTTFAGVYPQPNDWHDSWAVFYRDNRLAVQMHILQEQGRLNGEREKRLERVLSRLEDWIPDKPAASLLHGDLWSGNWLVDSSGKPVLIDPAAYFGDREMDMAMADLFGGFPDRFHDAYRECFPLLPEYDERRPLYQLYYLLIHLAYFGETYGPQVDRILQRYGG